MSTTLPAAPRRRPRRGSLERPVSGRLYRGAFLACSLPLLVLAFSVVRPGALPGPSLPPNFDARGARSLAVDLSTSYPDRVPGNVGARGAARWFRDQMRLYGLPVTTDSWQGRAPGLGDVGLENMWAVASGRSQDAIVVMAHRDDTVAGPGANDDASGTAALVELARGYAQGGTPTEARVQPEHTIVFLSTDGGAYGGLGADRFAAHLPFRVSAVVNLVALAGSGPPRIVIAGDRPRSPAGVLVETAAKRVLEQTGERARRTSFLGQLVDLALPFTLYEQGPFVAAGIPAITLTTAGERPPNAFTDRPAELSAARLGGIGRAAQELVASLDQGIDLTRGTTSYVWAGDRVVRGWAVELLLFALLVPYLAAVVDLFALCRRRRIALLPAARSLRSRLSLWLFAGLAFAAFRTLGAWPRTPDRPPNPALPASGDWPVLALVALALLVLGGWTVVRSRLVPRRPVSADEKLGGQVCALTALGIVALLVLATNPFALVFVLPPLHLWLWLPQVGERPLPVRILLLGAGLVGPLLVPLSFAVRFGLGLDSPWYVLQLVSIGYIPLTAIVLTLAAGACAAQLGAAVTGRYAPYPTRRERPARGPIRNAVRSLVLAQRASRSRREGRKRAFGG